MENVITALVGSRAHGLEHPDSDYDWRGVFKEPLNVHLSPFRKVKNNHWIEGDEDNTAYELIQFIKGCCQSNPNYLEVVYAPEFKNLSPIGKELIDNKHRFLSAQRVFDSHRGYAMNQYKKMNLFEPDDRTAKFCVAYIRSLHNGAQLLKHGEMTINLPEGKLKDDLLAIKYDFKGNKKLAMVYFEQKQKEIIDAMASTKLPTQAEQLYWEHFITKHYA